MITWEGVVLGLAPGILIGVVVCPMVDWVVRGVLDWWVGRGQTFRRFGFRRSIADVSGGEPGAGKLYGFEVDGGVITTSRELTPALQALMTLAWEEGRRGRPEQVETVTAGQECGVDGGVAGGM